MSETETNSSSQSDSEGEPVNTSHTDEAAQPLATSQSNASPPSSTVSDSETGSTTQQPPVRRATGLSDSAHSSDEVGSQNDQHPIESSSSDTDAETREPLQSSVNNSNNTIPMETNAPRDRHSATASSHHSVASNEQPSPAKTAASTSTFKSRLATAKAPPTTIDDLLSGKCRRVTSPRSATVLASLGYREADLVPRTLRDMLPAARFDKYVARRKLEHFEQKRVEAVDMVKAQFESLINQQSIPAPNSAAGSPPKLSAMHSDDDMYSSGGFEHEESDESDAEILSGDEAAGSPSTQGQRRAGTSFLSDRSVLSASTSQPKVSVVEPDLRPRGATAATMSTTSKSGSFVSSVRNQTVSARVQQLQKRQDKVLQIAQMRKDQVTAYEEEIQRKYEEHQRKLQKEEKKQAKLAREQQEMQRLHDFQLVQDELKRQERRRQRIKQLELEKERILHAQQEAGDRQAESEMRHRRAREIRNAEKRQAVKERRAHIQRQAEEILEQRIADGEAQQAKTEAQIEAYQRRREKEQERRSYEAEVKAKAALQRRRKVNDKYSEKVRSQLDKFATVEEVQERIRQELEMAREQRREEERERNKRRVEVRLDVEKRRKERANELLEKIKKHEALLEEQREMQRQLQLEIRIDRENKIEDKLRNVERTKRMQEHEAEILRQKTELKKLRGEEMRQQEEMLAKQRQEFKKQLESMKSNKVVPSPGPGQYLGVGVPKCEVRRAPAHRMGGATANIQNEYGVFAPGPAGYTPNVDAVLTRHPMARLPTHEGQRVSNDRRAKNAKANRGVINVNRSKTSLGVVELPVTAELVRPSSVPSQVSTCDFDRTKQKKELAPTNGGGAALNLHSSDFSSTSSENDDEDMSYDGSEHGGGKSPSSPTLKSGHSISRRTENNTNNNNTNLDVISRGTSSDTSDVTDDEDNHNNNYGSKGSASGLHNPGSSMRSPLSCSRKSFVSPPTTHIREDEDDSDDVYKDDFFDDDADAGRVGVM